MNRTYFPLLALFLAAGLGFAQTAAVSFRRVLDTPYPGHSGTAGGDLAVADFNGDGRLDIIVSGLQNTGFVTLIHFQTASGGFGAAVRSGHGLPSLDRGAVLRAADLDGDRDIDLVVYGRTGVAMQTALFQVFLNNGVGVFSLSEDLGRQLLSEDSADPVGAWGRSGSGADVQSDAEVLGLYNAQGWSAGILELVDLNGDSRPDIVFAGTKGMESGTDAAGQMIQRDWETSGVFLNQGSGRFSARPGSGYPAAGVPANPATSPERSWPGLPKLSRGFAASGDFNGDGWMDLAVFGQANAGAQANAGIPETQRNGLPVAEVCLGNGDGSFRPLADAGLPPLIDGAARCVDLNRDGKLDLVVMGNTGRTGDPAGGRLTRIYLGQGDGRFREDAGQVYDNVPNSVDRLVPMMSGDIGVGDLDGDGDLDLVMIGNANDRALYVYLNTAGRYSFVELDKARHGLGSNTVRGTGSSDATTEGDLFVGDLDGDGDADIVINGRGGAFQLLALRNLLRP